MPVINNAGIRLTAWLTCRFRSTRGSFHTFGGVPIVETCRPVKEPVLIRHRPQKMRVLVSHAFAFSCAFKHGQLSFDVWTTVTATYWTVFILVLRYGVQLCGPGMGRLFHSSRHRCFYRLVNVGVC